MTRWLAPSLLVLLLTAASPTLAQDQPLLVGPVIKVTDGATIKVQLSSGPITVRLVPSPPWNNGWVPCALDLLV